MFAKKLYLLPKVNLYNKMYMNSGIELTLGLTLDSNVL